MTTPRRAFVMSSIEQYVSLIINVSVVATMARLLTPDAVGHAVAGLGIGAILLSLREFVTSEFLIQKAEVDHGDLCTAFTVLLLITALITAAVLLLSPEIATFYGAPELSPFLFLVMMSAFAEVISQPIITILRRNMTFGVLANIRTASLVVSALTTVCLGMLGLGYLSYAWAMLAGSVTLAFLAVLIAPFPLSCTYRLSLVSWPAVYRFGRFKGASQAVDRIFENVPQLILGKVISMASVGLYNRANTICGIPDRVVVSAFYAMAFPVLANSAREGKNIKQAYIRTLSYLSVLYMPGALLVAVTAEPIVNLVLGPQWHEAILLVRLMAVAAAFWFVAIVTNPLLLALDQNRDAFLSSLFCRSVAAITLCGASTHGVLAMALSQFVSLPIQILIAIYFAKRHLGFTTAEFLSAIYPSLTVTLLALTGPLIVLATNDSMEMIQFGLTLLCAACGWLAGIVIIRHPFLGEIQLIAGHLLHTYAKVCRCLTSRGV